VDLDSGKPRILFVDDEPFVLASLRAAFRKDRERWSLVFATSAVEALEQLGRAACNVVVSDMRMPGMDGEQLLRRVQTEFPAAFRIMLTGQADPAAVARLCPILHAFLAKPCEIAHLRSAIESALGTMTAG
jgi:DNA-binding NtrC family response regulator